MSLQSHSQVLNALDSKPALNLSHLARAIPADDGRVFVASVSPQVRASLAATYGVSKCEAGWMIDHLLGGPQGLASGGMYGNGFSWIVDTNAMREAILVLGADEVMDSLQNTTEVLPGEEPDGTFKPKKPILSSACPGWICYAEKTHPHILPHLSRLKSPQALAGTLLKTVLSHRLGIRPDQIWHVSIMPCFDKKLEASREELTDIYWRSQRSESAPPVHDVDCVITANELVMLADTRGISFPSLPRHPRTIIPFPDPLLSTFLFPNNHHLDNDTTQQETKNRSSRSRGWAQQKQPPEAGTSGGYLHHILATQQALHPGSVMHTTRGRNADVVEYALVTRDDNPTPLFKAARYYGFRNIQNLVRKLKPPRQSRLPQAGPTRTIGGGSVGGGGPGLDYGYVEVMACPGGCTNGGGQLKAQDIDPTKNVKQKEWLAMVDEAYFSFEDSSEEEEEEPEEVVSDQQLIINGISPTHIRSVLGHWASLVGIPRDKLVTTTFRVVVSDVGKGNVGQTERVAELAGRIGGGW